MGNRALAIGLGWLITALLWLPQITEAATYQLQVASIPERVFLYFEENHTLPRIGAYLDNKQRSKFVVFRDRQPQPLKFLPSEQSEPLFVDATLPKRNDPWGQTIWSGESGHLAVFRIRGKQSNYQRLRRVAVQIGGALTRFPVRRIPSSAQSPIQVPATTASYLAHALESGTFMAWAERRAASFDGLSVIVGRHHDTRQSDTVYLLVRVPRTDQAYKVVLGWENLEHERRHGYEQDRQPR